MTQCGALCGIVVTIFLHKFQEDSVVEVVCDPPLDATWTLMVEPRTSRAGFSVLCCRLSPLMNYSKDN